MLLHEMYNVCLFYVSVLYEQLEASTHEASELEQVLSKHFINSILNQSITLQKYLHDRKTRGWVHKR